MNGRPAKFVDVEWDLDVTCTNGPALAHLRARAAVRGSAFTSNVDSAGTRQQLSGHFASVHKAVGQGQLSFPTPDGGSCRSDLQRFVAQG